MSIFAERLKELRMENNLSQSELARNTGLSQTAIGKWESDKRRPSIDVLTTLCDYFKVSADFLVGLKDE